MNLEATNYLYHKMYILANMNNLLMLITHHHIIIAIVLARMFIKW